MRVTENDMEIMAKTVQLIFEKFLDTGRTRMYI